MKSFSLCEYWKNELIDTANFLLGIYNSKINEELIFDIEKRILTCFIHIRQYKEYYFNENRKNPEEIDLTCYPIVNTDVDDYDFGRRYNLFANIKEKTDIYLLCHYFIHIDINSCFAPIDDRAYGLFFSPERKSSKALYYIPLYMLSQIFLSLANNEIIGIKLIIKKNEKNITFKYNNIWE